MALPGKEIPIRLGAGVSLVSAGWCREGHGLFPRLGTGLLALRAAHQRGDKCDVEIGSSYSEP